MEWIGYIATLLTVLSFVPKSQRKLRLINAIASVVWIIYGIVIVQLPIILVNLCVLIVHGYWFSTHRGKKYKNNYTYIHPSKRNNKKLMTQTEWNKNRDKMAEQVKADPEFMYKWIKDKSGK